MKKFIVGGFMIIAYLTSSGAVLADQAYGGFGLSPVSGQRNFAADGLLNFNLAYEPTGEGLAGWRFSHVMTSFKRTDADSITIKSQILAAEQLYIAIINPKLALIGAFGPGLFISNVQMYNNNSGMSIGLSVAGSVRYAISDVIFLDGAYHYKNCAVMIDEGVIDAGYQGLFLNVGFIF